MLEYLWTMVAMEVKLLIPSVYCDKGIQRYIHTYRLRSMRFACYYLTEMQRAVLPPFPSPWQKGSGGSCPFVPAPLVRRCWDPPKFRHLLHHKSGRLATFRLINSILLQLQSNGIGRNETRTMLMSRPAS